MPPRHLPRYARLAVFGFQLLLGAAWPSQPLTASDLERPLSSGSTAAAILPTPNGGNVTRILIEVGASRRLYASLYFSWLYILHERRFAQWEASFPPGAIPGTHSVYTGDATFSNLYLWMTQKPLPGDTIFHSSDHAVSWQTVPPPPNT